MPRARHTSRGLVAAESLAVLAQLAHEGAYVTAVDPSGTTGAGCPIRSPRNNFAEPVSYVSQRAVAHALRKNWLAPDKSGDALRLSALGLRTLRAAKSGASRAASRTNAPHPGEGLHRPGAEGALAWLRGRKDKDGRPLITQVQFNAGEMLAADFWHAQMSPRVTASWSAAAPARRMRRGVPGFGVDVRDGVAAAQQRFRRALRAVGPELAGILVEVCCHDVGLEAAGQALGWPQRAAKVVLDLALTRLARHYGLLAPERPAAGRLRHWGDEDFRPTLDTWR